MEFIKGKQASGGSRAQRRLIELTLAAARKLH